MKYIHVFHPYGVALRSKSVPDGFVTKDFKKKWNNSVYSRLSKMLCGFKDQVRARPSGEKCGLDGLLLSSFNRYSTNHASNALKTGRPEPTEGLCRPTAMQSISCAASSVFEIYQHMLSFALFASLRLCVK